MKCMWCELAVDLVDKNVLPNIKNESELQQNITNLCEKLLPNNKTLVRYIYICNTNIILLVRCANAESSTKTSHVRHLPICLLR